MKMDCIEWCVTNLICIDITGKSIKNVNIFRWILNTEQKKIFTLHTHLGARTPAIYNLSNKLYQFPFSVSRSKRSLIYIIIIWSFWSSWSGAMTPHPERHEFYSFKSRELSGLYNREFSLFFRVSRSKEENFWKMVKYWQFFPCFWTPCNERLRTINFKGIQIPFPSFVKKEESDTDL